MRLFRKKNCRKIKKISLVSSPRFNLIDWDGKKGYTSEKKDLFFINLILTTKVMALNEISPRGRPHSPKVRQFICICPQKLYTLNLKFMLMISGGRFFGEGGIEN